MLLHRAVLLLLLGKGKQSNFQIQFVNSQIYKLRIPNIAINEIFSYISIK